MRVVNCVVGVRCGTLHEAEACGEKPCDSGREDETESGHEDDGAEDEQAGGDLRETAAESEETDAEKCEDKAGLQRNENAGKSGRGALVAFEFDGDGSGFEEALAGFGAHVGEELFVVSEALYEAGVYFALHLEDAGPAAVFKEGASEPKGDSHEGEESEEWPDAIGDLPYDGRGLGAGTAFLPCSAQESIAATAAGVGEVGEEVEVRVADDFRMKLQEPCELGVGAADVLLIREERRIGANDVGEGWAHAKEAHELGAGVGDVALGGDCRGDGLSRGFGRLRVGCVAAGEDEQQK